MTLWKWFVAPYVRFIWYLENQILETFNIIIVDTIMLWRSLLLNYCIFASALCKCTVLMAVAKILAYLEISQYSLFQFDV